MLDDELGRSILDIYQADVCDDYIAGIFEQRASKHKFQQSFHGSDPFKNPKLVKGDYTIGLDTYALTLDAKKFSEVRTSEIL